MSRSTIVDPIVIMNQDATSTILIMNQDYTVSLNRDHFHMQSEILYWCSEQFGPMYIEYPDQNWRMSERWCMSQIFGMQKYTFKDELDAMLFTLRWL